MQMNQKNMEILEIWKNFMMKIQNLKKISIKNHRFTKRGDKMQEKFGNLYVKFLEKILKKFIKN